jgi:hypothetical protein
LVGAALLALVLIFVIRMPETIETKLVEKN